MEDDMNHNQGPYFRGYDEARLGGPRLVVFSSTGATEDERPLDPRLDIRSHSPDGFQWGYMGSGPSQLALAMLANVLQIDRDLLRSSDGRTFHDFVRLYQTYKSEVIAHLPQSAPWVILRSDVVAWLKRNGIDL